MRNIQIAFVLLLYLFAMAANAERKTTTLKVGDSVPRLAFDPLDGGEKAPNWKDLEGKVVVFDFWASWCAPCVESFPELNQLKRQFEDRNVEFISITYEPKDHVREFLKTHPLQTLTVIDRDSATFKSFGAWAIPAVYLFDRAGRVVSAQHPSDLTAEILNQVLEGEIPDVEQSLGWEDPEGAEEYFRSLRTDLVESAKPSK